MHTRISTRVYRDIWEHPENQGFPDAGIHPDIGVIEQVFDQQIVAPKVCPRTLGTALVRFNKGIWAQGQCPRAMPKGSAQGYHGNFLNSIM
jgi:hypothetical protein